MRFEPIGGAWTMGESFPQMLNPFSPGSYFRDLRDLEGDYFSFEDDQEQDNNDIK